MTLDAITRLLRLDNASGAGKASIVRRASQAGAGRSTRPRARRVLTTPRGNGGGAGCARRPPAGRRRRAFHSIGSAGDLTATERELRLRARAVKPS